MKYYFSDLDDSGCYTMEYWLEFAADNYLEEITLYEAIPDPIKNVFWCNEYDEPLYGGECGRQCDKYDPINGKSGKCRSKVGCYERGEKVIVKINLTD